jgi:alpha-L-rhamnosidase
MHSGFAASFHESLGGIRPDADHPGFKHFFLKPCFLPDLDWAKVTYRSPYGLIDSSWKREDGVLIWSVTIPENSTAEVQLHAFSINQINLNQQSAQNNTITLQAGEHTILISE